ncbi:MAG: DUF1194 domain-containing protein [Paracoccaceae bacterium]
MFRLRALLMTVAALAAFECTSASARGCSLALLLAIDISGSVDDGEYRLQVDGTADALEDPDIQSALLSGPVTLSVMQWSAVGMQKIVQPWQRMETMEDIRRFGADARIQERAFGKADTAVSDAISTAVRAFDDVPDCPKRVIDISGDGVQNAGGPLPLARNKAIAAGITINAIAIEGIGLTISEFFRRNVVTKGGFVITARGHTDYPRAIREKILREIVVPLG